MRADQLIREDIAMTNPSPTLHVLCGKIAAGKSTLAARLGGLPETVLVAEDAWLNALYPGEVQSPNGLPALFRAAAPRPGPACRGPARRRGFGGARLPGEHR